MHRTALHQVRAAAVAAGMSVAAVTPALAQFPPHYTVRLDTELHGLDVAVRTSASAAAIAQLENRTGRNVFCSVGFYHGLDLRKRTTRMLQPGERRLFTYPVRQLVGSVPIEVVCDAWRESLPKDRFS